MTENDVCEHPEGLPISDASISRISISTARGGRVGDTEVTVIDPLPDYTSI